MTGNDIIVTIKSNDPGSILNRIVSTNVSANTGGANTNVAIPALTSTEYTVVPAATTTTENVYPLEARGDVVNAEEEIAGTADSSENHTKVHWLGS